MSWRPSAKTLGKTLAILLPALATFEGTRYTSYQDAVNVWTICQGHTAGVRPGQTATPADCREMTQADATAAYNQMVSAVNTPLSDGETLAYTDFVFNAGIGTFKNGSALGGNSLAKRINAGKRLEACNALMLYDKAGGKTLPGLVKRRAWEKEQCLGGLNGTRN